MEEIIQEEGSLFSIFESLSDTEFTLDNFQKNKQLNKLSNRIGVSIKEALFFCLIFRLSVNDNNGISISDIAPILGTNNLTIYKYYADLLLLEKKKLIEIQRGSNRRDIKIYMPLNVFNLIVSGVDTIHREQGEKSFADISQQMMEMMNKPVRSEYEVVARLNSLRELYLEGENLPQVKYLLKKNMCIENVVIMCCLVNMKMRSNDESTSFNEILERLYYSSDKILKMRNAFLSGNHKLVQCKLVEHDAEDFLSDDNIMLTDLAVEKLIGDIVVVNSTGKIVPFHSKFVAHSSCVEKKMFFDEGFTKELKRIEKVLGYRNFNKYQKRAKNRNVAPGMNILLYGESGTGKTEIVKQLSRITKRDVLMVDIANIRQKYIGDSEKKISKIFREYRAVRKQSNRAPILLFNEADAILNKRTEVFQSTDQMNNNMQNILLQELEDFDGILIATTNLKKALDAAFDRRFVMKIAFEKPSKKVQVNILKSKFEAILSNEQMENISNSYDLSGGQMDNILKNLEMKILLGEEVEDDFLQAICISEIGHQHNSKNQIGFSFGN